MYKPKYIKIQNIGTLEDIDYNFQTGKSQIIQGKNLSDKGQKNNGVGKSFFIDSIAFALTGIVLSGRTLEEIISDKSDSGYIEILLINGKNELLIKRTLSRKKPQLVEIYKNGEAKHTNESDVNSRNQFIIDEIGIAKEDLFRFFLISKDRFKPYFKLSDNEKKEITSRFSNADKIDGVFPLVESDVLKEEAIKKEISDSILKLESKVETYKNLISDLENENSDEAKKQLVDSYQSKIEENKTNIESTLILIENLKKDKETNEVAVLDKSKEVSEIESALQEIQTSIVEVEKTIEGIENIMGSKTKDLNQLSKDLEDELESIRKENNENTKLKNEIQSSIVKIESQLSSSIECPSCEHEFILKSDFTVDELKSSLQEFKTLLTSTEETILSTKTKFDGVSDKLNKCYLDIKETRKEGEEAIKECEQEIFSLKKESNQLEQNINSLKREVSTLESNQTIIDNKIKQAESSIETYNNSIKGLEQNILDVDKIDTKETINKYQKLIEECKNSLLEENEKLTEQQEKIANLSSWILKFKAFKSYLANLSLKNIQDLINSYLQQMNTDLSIEIEGYKQKGKKITEKITEQVLRNGFHVGSYNRFSGGERGRIDVASILANQTLINNNAAPNGLDLILVDEILESLDSTGIEGIIKSMDNIDKTMLLITQNDINSLPEQTITFIKENGVTRIEGN